MKKITTAAVGLLIILGTASAYAETITLTCPQVVPGKNYNPYDTVAKIVVLGKEYSWIPMVRAVQYGSANPWTNASTQNVGGFNMFLECGAGGQYQNTVTLPLDGGGNADCHQGKRIRWCSGSGSSAFYCDLETC